MRKLTPRDHALEIHQATEQLILRIGHEPQNLTWIRLDVIARLARKTQRLLESKTNESGTDSNNSI